MIATREGLIPLPRAIEALGVHPRTVRRWIWPGLCDGRVRLSVTRIGGRVFVREEDLERFQRDFERVRFQRPAVPNPPTRRLASDRRKAEAILNRGRR